MLYVFYQFILNLSVYVLYHIDIYMSDLNFQSPKRSCIRLKRPSELNPNAILFVPRMIVSIKKFHLNPCASRFYPRRHYKSLNPEASPFRPKRGNSHVSDKIRIVCGNTLPALESNLNPSASIFNPAIRYSKIDTKKQNNILSLPLIHVTKTGISHDIFEPAGRNNNSDLIKLEVLRKHNPGKIIIGELNINSIRNKIDELAHIIGNSVDILLVSETKLDNSFPEGQFYLKGFSRPYRCDRNAHGGGLLLYIRDHIPSKEIKIDQTKIECLIVELNLKKRKWLLHCSYNPHKNMIGEHLLHISRQLDVLSTKFDNFLLLGDLNSELSENLIKTFCGNYSLKNLVKEPTCFKNIHKPTCIDLILTNRVLYFQNTTVFETGLSDFHKLVITIMKSTYQKQTPNIIQYRSYKKFVEKIFRNDLYSSMIELDVNTFTYQKFEETFMGILNQHAPLKKRYVRANTSEFINPTISKAIMTRSRLKKRFLKNKSDESWNNYRTQRNLCVTLIRKNKKKFYENLDVKSVTDNKRF